MNCPGVRSAGALASRRPWRWDVRKVFNTEEQGGRRGPRSRMHALRAKRFEPLLRGPPRPPCFLCAKIFPGLRTAHFCPVVGSNGGFKRLPRPPAKSERTAETHQQTTNMERRRMRRVTRGSVSDNAADQPACRDNLTALPTRVAGASLQQHALRHDLGTQSNELRGRLNHKPSRPAQRVLLAPCQLI